MGRPAAWLKCEHYYGVVQGLRYPNLVKYGTLRVCVRCRARRFEFFETGEVRIDPPVPINFRRFRHRGAAYNMGDPEE